MRAGARGPLRTTTETYQTIAWDGLSFDVPQNWNPASFKLRRGNTVLKFEDEYSARLDVEWVRPRRKRDLERTQKRYDGSARKLNEGAQKTEEVTGLPEHWVAFLYVMPEHHKLLSAFYLSQQGDLFCFFIMHVGPKDEEDPKRLMKTIARSFRTYNEGVVPWVLYDVNIGVPAEFRLVNTDVQTGKKLLVFAWKGRHYYVWHVSLADLIIKKYGLERWVADLLNTCRLIRGPVFKAEASGEITFGRRLWNRFGHYDEILRGCRRYRARYTHDKERNRLVVWVYNFRREDDLVWLDRIRPL